MAIFSLTLTLIMSAYLPETYQDAANYINNHAWYHASSWLGRAVSPDIPTPNPNPNPSSNTIINPNPSLGGEEFPNS